MSAPVPHLVTVEGGKLAAYVTGNPQLYMDRIVAAHPGNHLIYRPTSWAEVAGLAKITTGTGGTLYDADCTPLDPRCPVPGLEWQVPGVEVRLGDRAALLLGFTRPHGYARLWFAGTKASARELAMPEALRKVEAVPPMELPA